MDDAGECERERDECDPCADNGVGGWETGPARFLVAGAFVLDCLISASGLPSWGADLRADAMRTVPGGKALNQAVTLARLGGRVAAVGSVGRDSVGAAIRSVLAADGVDVSAMPVRSGASTPVCVVHSRADGEKAVVWRVPDELAATAADLDEAARALSGGGGGGALGGDRGGGGDGGGDIDATVVTFEFPHAAADLVAAAARLGRWVVVHPAPAASRPELVRAMPWDLVDVLVPNEAEARALLVGHPGANGPAGQLADALAENLGVPTVCVTLGAQGCVLHTMEAGPGERSSSHPAPTAQVVDTTAASDAFTAVFTARLVAGDSPRAAVHAAQRAAALTIGRAGGYEALPNHAELRELLAARSACLIPGIPVPQFLVPPALLSPAPVPRIPAARAPGPSPVARTAAARGAGPRGAAPRSAAARGAGLGAAAVRAGVPRGSR
ncbi:hypothetical protein FAIPA1_70068 [Frankia sp. AiPs1]